MMIFLKPQFASGTLNISKQGDSLTINGDVLDFTDLPEGGEYPPEAIDNDFVVGGVKRVDGDVHIAVLLPYSNPNPPRAVAFPDPVTVTADGVIALPEGRDAPEPEELENDNAAE